MGFLSKISGPVVIADGMAGSKINEVVKIGEKQLFGEIIAVKYDKATIQVYEDTSGLRPGEKVEPTKLPLTVEVGPGLLGAVFDGIQRPIDKIRKKSGDFIARGIHVPALDRHKKWDFAPSVKKGDVVESGDELGVVEEFNILHRVLVPPGVSGKVESVSKGNHTVQDVVAVVGGEKVSMLQKWPVRSPRPYSRKLGVNLPLVTGMRILDTFFPVAKGGTACIPGPFGSGKCVSGKTPVLLGNGSLVPIEELFNSCRKKGKVEKTVFEETIHLNEPLSVFSFSGKKLVKTTTSLLYKGKSDSLVRINTRSGRTVEVTPVHKLFKITPELEIEETPASDLKKGDFIVAIRKTPSEGEKSVINLSALKGLRVADKEPRETISHYLKKAPKKLEEISQDTAISFSVLERLRRKEVLPTIGQVKTLYAYFVLPSYLPKKVRGQRKGTEVSLPLQLSEDLAEFLGFFLAEGYLRGQRTVVFTNCDETFLERFRFLARMLFGITGKIERQKGKAPNVLLNSVAIVKYLKAINAKKVPSVILQSDEKCTAAFLRAYFLGDGSYYSGQIEFSTAESQVGTGVSYLLTKLGVAHSQGKKIISGKSYSRLFVRGRKNLEKLANAFAVCEHEKLAKIRNYCKKTIGSWSSTDIVPVSPAFASKIYEEAGRPYSLLKKAGVEITNYTTQKEKMSSETFLKFSSALHQHSNGKTLVASQSKLTQFAEALEWIFCDEIVSHEELSGPFNVFDLTVPQTHNFVGGFGAMLLHNTVTQTSLAKYVDADIIVYIGCGERGNEMTEVLTEFPKLLDPKTKKPLMERTVLIANTSNMPVAAREASVYTGITLAEYYRDMGYDVAIMADSTSRWAEAMREISGRMEEMPGEEGYPAYLARRLAEFYERAGRVQCKGTHERIGSVSVIGAISPPGGDVSEPVSQGTFRVTKVFWALDASLSRRRHYPAIHWLRSYTLYGDVLGPWYSEKVAGDFEAQRARAMALLQKEADLQNIVQLIGPDALPDKERLVLEATRLIREDFLQQNAFDELDAYTSLKRQYLMLKTILHFYDRAVVAMGEDVLFDTIVRAPVKTAISRLKSVPEEDFEKKVKELEQDVEKTFAKYASEVRERVNVSQKQGEQAGSKNSVKAKEVESTK
ncbi:MAG: V-type ATP synthase subunit A [Candidatus Micrarchaeia archaeon]